MSTRSLIRTLSVCLTALAALVALASPGQAWVKGSNDVVGVRSAETGRGPGWVALSYKLNGPTVGYLFAKDFTFNGQPRGTADRFYVRGTAKSGQPNIAITVWPWGYAGGDFGGCAFAYGTSALQSGTPNSSSTAKCAGGPTVKGSSRPGGKGQIDQNRWWHSHAAFCTDQARHALCSPQGVWSANNFGERDTGNTLPGVGSNGRSAKVTANSFVVANIGNAAVAGSAPAKPSGVIGGVFAGDTVGVRYVTKSGWAMVKVTARQGSAVKNPGQLQAGMVWGFVPVDHLAV